MRCSFPLAVLALTFVTANAFAADAGTNVDVDSLLEQLQHDYTTLSTQDCALACKAYASIRRAADKICGLEPGPRCSEARAKADDAQRRVQAACPDCPIAAAPGGKDDERRAVQPAPPPPTDSSAGGESATESAPRKGGCASCNTPGGRPTGDVGVIFVGAFAVARILRRPSSRRSRR